MMSKLKYIFYLLLVTFISSFFLLNRLGKKLSPILIKYVNIEANRFANNIVNSTINEIIVLNYDDNIFNITKNDKDEITMLDYDTKSVNRLLLLISDEIQKRLTNLEEGKIEELEISSNFKLKNFKKLKDGVLCEVPMGALKKNPLFANMGPNIPIKLSFIGQVQSNLETKITSYGINNIVIETYIVVCVEEQITMPTTSKNNILEIKAPLTIRIIKGIVPNYYTKGVKESDKVVSNE